MGRRKEHSETYYARNREKQLAKANARLREPGERWRAQFLARKWAAKKRGIEFTIELKDLVIPAYCPILEVRIVSEEVDAAGRRDRRYSPSIDRVDPSKGYVPGNVRVISSLANNMKQNATFEELESFAKNIGEYVKKC